MKYGVIKTKFFDGSGFETFKVYETFEEALAQVNVDGGFIVKLVEVKEDE